VTIDQPSNQMAQMAQTSNSHSVVGLNRCDLWTLVSSLAGHDTAHNRRRVLWIYEQTDCAQCVGNMNMTNWEHAVPVCCLDILFLVHTLWSWCYSHVFCKTLQQIK